MDLAAAITSTAGLQAQGELGWHFAPSWSVYGSASVDRLGYGAGVGVRGTW